MVIKNTTIAILFAFFCTVVYSQDKGGTAGLTFLKMDVSARAMSLGGAYIGLGDDASTLFYNPAGMVNLKKAEVIATYNEWIDDIKYSYVGAVYPLPQLNASVGLQGAFLSSGDIVETTPDQSSYEGTGRTFGATDMMIGVSYAQVLTTKFSVGGTLKLINENLASESIYSFAGDVATYYNTEWKSLIFGMAIKNFGTNYTYYQQDDPIPMIFSFGVAFDPLNKDANKISVLMEASHPSDNAEYITLGCEYSYNNMFFVRVGRRIDDDEYWLVKNSDDGDLDPNYESDAPELKDYDTGGINWMGTTLGLGFQLESMGLKIDYGFKHMGDLGITNMVTFGYEFDI